jgi:hypothetical protein
MPFCMVYLSSSSPAGRGRTSPFGPGQWRIEGVLALAGS